MSIKKHVHIVVYGNPESWPDPRRWVSSQWSPLLTLEHLRGVRHIPR